MQLFTHDTLVSFMELGYKGIMKCIPRVKKYYVCLRRFIDLKPLILFLCIQILTLQFEFTYFSFQWHGARVIYRRATDRTFNPKEVRDTSTHFRKWKRCHASDRKKRRYLYYKREKKKLLKEIRVSNVWRNSEEGWC